ncbi:MAG: hypothetical protein IPP94_17675 [Ignavibacteria bacterium]|nr:hypothetical protein [Ignavibacteria bacterium]
MNITPRKYLLRLALLGTMAFLLNTGTAFAAELKPEQTVLLVGTSHVHVGFQTMQLARAMNEHQLKLVAAAIGPREGDFFFIVSDEAPTRVFACKPFRTANVSLSINLPPNSTLLRVTSSLKDATPALQIGGISNESNAWSSFSSVGEGAFIEHRRMNGFATVR